MVRISLGIRRKGDIYNKQSSKEHCLCRMKRWNLLLLENQLLSRSHKYFFCTTNIKNCYRWSAKQLGSKSVHAMSFLLPTELHLNFWHQWNLEASPFPPENLREWTQFSVLSSRIRLQHREDTLKQFPIKL